jgi:hypothetical protein
MFYLRKKYKNILFKNKMFDKDIQMCFSPRRKVIPYDLRLDTPCRAFFAGPSDCGKTYRLFQILRYAHLMFKEPEHFRHIIVFYNVWTKEYSNNIDLVDLWINHPPTEDDIVKYSAPFKEKFGCVMIIDDFGARLSQDIVDFFTVKSHNLNISAFLINQNLFPRKSFARDITLSTTDTLIFSNPRDPSSISHFGKQFKPGNVPYVRSSYNNSCEEPFAYLWINQRPNRIEGTTRVINNRVIDEWPISSYIENKIDWEKELKR